MLSVITLSLGQLQTNCHIVYDDSTLKTLVIDPGDEPEKIISVIENKHLSVEAVILTHGHFDHIAAVDDISKKYGAQIFINKNDIEFLSNPDYNLSSKFISGGITVTNDNIKAVNDCKKLFLDREFEFISTPGHSPGSMCIKVENMLFTGDTLFYMSVGNEFPPFGSFDVEIKSIKNKLLNLNDDYVCYCGHGPSTTLDYERNNNPYLERF